MRFEITNIMAMSIDGAIASHSSEADDERKTYGFGADADRAHLERQLFEADAVIVSGNSLRCSGGLIQKRNRHGSPVEWLVVTKRGQEILSGFSGSDQIVTVSPAGTESAHIEFQGDDYITPIQSYLVKRNAKKVILFGGGTINREFYIRGLVNRLILTVCPVIFGRSTSMPLVAPGLDDVVRLELVSLQSDQNLVFLTYNVHLSS